MSTEQTRETWDAQAATFDDEPDHGLGDPTTRAAWRSLLLEHLPAAPARVADLGCGTGTLSVLLAEEGYDVTGVDLAPAMIERARAKASRLPSSSVRFAVGDAADPDLPVGSFDVVLSRHVLWALPDPAAAVARWSRMLGPEGRLVMVEGHWSTGSGITAAHLVDLVTGAGLIPDHRVLDDPAYWGGTVTDERYVVVARRR